MVRIPSDGVAVIVSIDGLMALPPNCCGLRRVLAGGLELSVEMMWMRRMESSGKLHGAELVSCYCICNALTCEWWTRRRRGWRTAEEVGARCSRLSDGTEWMLRICTQGLRECSMQSGMLKQLGEQDGVEPCSTQGGLGCAPKCCIDLTHCPGVMREMCHSRLLTRARAAGGRLIDQIRHCGWGGGGY